MSEGYANTQRYSESSRNQTDKKSHNAVLCFILLSTLLCDPQEGLRGSMKMILVVSLEFSRCRACGPEFLVELKQKC